MMTMLKKAVGMPLGSAKKSPLFIRSNPALEGKTHPLPGLDTALQFPTSQHSQPQRHRD